MAATDREEFVLQIARPVLWIAIPANFVLLGIAVAQGNLDRRGAVLEGLVVASLSLSVTLEPRLRRWPRRRRKNAAAFGMVGLSLLAVATVPLVADAWFALGALLLVLGFLAWFALAYRRHPKALDVRLQAFHASHGR